MSFATVTLSGSASGTQGRLSTTGTFTAAITGNADGTITGTWSFAGTYRDSDVFYGTSGSKSISGTLTGTGDNDGPWAITLAGGGVLGGALTLAFANGQYSLAGHGGYAVDYTLLTGYDVEYTFHDEFQFNAALGLAGAAPTEDVASFAGARSGYTVAAAAGGYTVSGTGTGTQSVGAIERLQFSDLSVNLGIGAAAHGISGAQLDSLVELYIAYIDRVPDADGMAFWIAQLQAGRTLDQIGQSFYEAAVQFGDLTGYTANMSNGAFVTHVYQNVLGRSSPDAEGLAFWTARLETSGRGGMVAEMLASAHTFKGDATFGFVADLLDNKIAVGKLFAISDGLVFNTSAANITQGMAIVDAVTSTSTANAVALIGVNDGFSLY
ncbi:DUF4214 domain-containing protein [Ramlibacter sp. PS4R-6]|uniref:DUF4214 domain-containing protein n=1 Tax=Ramlibacter sp. PS4R-6 TaxID=3133438 RepID=UPI0030957A37